MADAVFHRDHGDPDTHVERINPGENPAYIPGIYPSVVPDEGRKAYRLRIAEKHGGDIVTLPGGTVVMLKPEEATDNHEPFGWERPKAKAKK